MNTVILGGTHQVNDYNTNVDVDDRRFIYDGCMKLNPAIKGADIIVEKVGLRPGRNRVRIEQDVFNTSKTFGLIINHACSQSAANLLVIFHLTNILLQSLEKSFTLFIIMGMAAAV